MLGLSRYLHDGILKTWNTPMSNENEPVHTTSNQSGAFKLRFKSRQEIGKSVLRRLAVFLIATAGVAGYLFVKDTFLSGGSRHIQSGKFNVVFTGAEPRNFQGGKASSCVLKADIVNQTKYHFTQMTFKIGNWQFEEDNFSANAAVEGQDIFTVDLSSGGNCAEQARYIIGSVSDAEIFDCSIPNLPEGDCQRMVSISTTMNLAKVAAVAMTDFTLGHKQLAPLKAALSEAELSESNFSPYDESKRSKYTKLLETIVSIDSASWSFNVYKPGSMRNISLAGQSPDGSSVTLTGSYAYDGIGGPVGEVAVKIPKNGLPCLVYHDMPKTCRSIVFPDVSLDH